MYSLENQTFNAEEITPSNRYYPDISPLSWEAHDINIVGSLNFTVLDGSGILVVDQIDTLTA
ncbi:MAG: hypothetical protein KDI30_13445 [Pseudomonadales bacterium]|nr:hypothetical protein [Pseudomonadales bacterium]